MDGTGLRDWGALGGKCCNASDATEFCLVGDGDTQPLDLANAARLARTAMA